MACFFVTTHSHAIFEVSATLICTIAPARITDYRSLAALAYLRTDALEVFAYLRKYDAAVSSYRFEVMKTHSYLPCEELRFFHGHLPLLQQS